MVKVECKLQDFVARIEVCSNLQWIYHKGSYCQSQKIESTKSNHHIVLLRLFTRMTLVDLSFNNKESSHAAHSR